MKHLITALALSMAAFTAPAFASSHKEAPAMANGATCDAQATEKKLAGAAKTSFLKKCNADSAMAAPMAAAAPMGSASCDAKAAEKKLAGAAKTSFVKKCSKDEASAGATTACETQAADKKLAGAAKTSFVKKCSSDMKVSATK